MKRKFLYFTFLIIFLNGCKEDLFTNEYLCKYNWVYVEKLNEKKVTYLFFMKFEINGKYDNYFIRSKTKSFTKQHDWNYNDEVLTLFNELNFKIIKFNKDTIVMKDSMQKNVYLINFDKIKPENIPK